MSTLFNSYSVKGNLKFYKSHNTDEKLTITISINADHQVDKNIYSSLNDFLENLLIEDYINEDSYVAIKEHEKIEKQQKKKQEKYEKEQEKIKKKLTKKKIAVVKKPKSLY